MASVERVEHPSPGDTEQFPESRAHQPTVATDRPARRCIRTHCGTGYALPPTSPLPPNEYAQTTTLTSPQSNENGSTHQSPTPK